jgi:hypothetical protein
MQFTGSQHKEAILVKATDGAFALFVYRLQKGEIVVVVEHLLCLC